MRLIDADAVKEIFLQDRCGDNFLPKHFVISTIDDAPTIEYSKNSLDYDYGFAEGLRRGKEKYEKRPKGKWILEETDYDDGGNNLYKCNNCHHSDTHSGTTEVPYCWYCGADMRDENNE